VSSSNRITELEKVLEVFASQLSFEMSSAKEAVKILVGVVDQLAARVIRLETALENAAKQAQETPSGE
jgi:hypothetical protein